MMRPGAKRLHLMEAAIDKKILGVVLGDNLFRHGTDTTIAPRPIHE